MISIHALLAESDLAYPDMIICTNVISIHALLAESDCISVNMLFTPTKFLSTLSLRRATSTSERLFMPSHYFYPRSPCGERPVKLFRQNYECFISIHALLAESDCNTVIDGQSAVVFLSTLSLRRATVYMCPIISTTTHFYPRSPCGERPEAAHERANSFPFLSTLSLRRATFCQFRGVLLVGNFYPRSPCGERRNGYPHTHRHGAISIHALLAESDQQDVFSEQS